MAPIVSNRSGASDLGDLGDIGPDSSKLGQ
jgi:hypothetical protein